jgi:RHS repeat-associated protein
VPIDIATGNVHIDSADLELPGRIELAWKRRYSSLLVERAGLWFGPGWSCPFGATLTRHAGGFEFTTPTGTIELFPDSAGAVERGEVVQHPGAFLEVFRDQERYVVQSWDADQERVRRYCFEASARGQAMRLASMETVSGDALDLVWSDADGRLQAVRQRVEQRELVLAHTRSGLIESVRLQGPGGPAQTVLRYEYDEHGRLAAAFDAAGFADRYEYGSDGRLEREVAKDGGVFSYRYDERGRCVRRSGLNHYDDKRLKFLDASRITEVTDSLGCTHRYQWLSNGQITAHWSPLGAHRQTEYDAHGRIVALVDAKGGRTEYTYDAFGNRDGMTDATGQVTRVTYGPHHRPLTLTDAVGQTWTREYDERLRMAGSRDPLGHPWRYTYDAEGNLAEIVNPLGARKQQRYRTGVLQAITDWMGRVTSFEFDLFGRVTERRGPQGDVTRLRYNAQGRPVQITLPDGRSLAAAYNHAGHMTRLVDAKGRITQWHFGPCGRLLERTDALEHKLRFVWSTEPGRIDQVINEKDEVFTFLHDEDGRIVEEQSFDGSTRTFRYDAEGHTIGWTLATGETVQIQRDAMHRVVAQALPDGRTARYAHDPSGLLVSAANEHATVLFERDPLGRIVKEMCNDDWVASSYDGMGALVGTATSGGAVTCYELDANGSLLKATVNDRHVLTFRRDEYGQEVARQMPGGASLGQRFDSVGRLLEQQIRPGAPAEAPRTRHYAYDENGALTRVADSRWGDTQYAYDPVERLIQTLESTGTAEHFAYDATGNITRMQREGSSSLDVALRYSPGNRLASKGDTRYEYDAAGRRIRKIAGESVWTYVWNALGQLLELSRPDGRVWRFTYDALGRRLSKGCADEPAGLRRYVWNRDVVAEERRDDGSDHWIFDPYSFTPLASLQDSRFLSVISDHLGTPIHLLDERGATAWAVQQGTWGEAGAAQAAGTPAARCPIAFPGQWRDDETGLHYNFHRYYDPDTGSYISPDPIGLEGGTQFYRYCTNPINGFDPYGFICVNDTNGGKGYVVYHITDGDGKVVYVGITQADRFQARQDEHRASGRLSGDRDMTRARTVDTYGEVRGYEQAHIEHYGTRDTSLIGNHDYENNPGNRINSYDPSRTDDRAVTFNAAHNTAAAELAAPGT